MDHQTSSTTTSSTSTSTSSHHHNPHLRHLHKSSHKISKPIIRKPPPHQLHQEHTCSSQQPPPPPPQPPVYNINKSDFRQVVQKLTGSPAHDHPSTAPPPPPPPFPSKPQPSRLHRIRPPPLAHLAARPPPPPAYYQSTPLSPLPPFPSVHAAAESPISAYMKCLRGTTQWLDLPPPSQTAEEQGSPKSTAVVGSGSGSGSGSVGLGQNPSIPSPRSPYPLVSPTGAQLGFPQFWS